MRNTRSARGARFKKAREAAGLTQQGLAERAKCDSSTVSRIERGTQTPTLAIAAAIAKALGIPLEELLGDRPRARSAA